MPRTDRKLARGRRTTACTDRSRKIRKASRKAARTATKRALRASY